MSTTQERKSERKPARVDPAGEEPAHRTYGRLVGVTATGPIYHGTRLVTVVPVTSALVTLQELARRIDSPEAAVQSSIAKRLKGKDAHAAWLALSVEFGIQLHLVSPRGRIKFLRLLINFIRVSGRSDGLETIYTSAINAAWPWLTTEACDRFLTLAERWISQSKVAQRHPVAVIDLSTRTVSVFGAGSLANVNIPEWRASLGLQLNGLSSSPASLGAALSDVTKSGLERAIDQLMGGDISAGSDVGALGSDPGSLVPGHDSSGVPGGLPGVSDVPGQKKTNGAGSSLQDAASQLTSNSQPSGIPGGLPSAADVPGSKKNGGSQTGHGNAASDVAQSAWTNEWSGGGVSGFLQQHGSGGFANGIFEGATPGGPFSQPGGLGIHGGGVEDGDDSGKGKEGDDSSKAKEGADEQKDNTGKLVVLAGAVLMLSGGGMALVGAAGLAGEAGLAVGIGAGGFAVGAFAVGLGTGYVFRGHKGDLYPDPWGEGGGNPAALPAFDGEGGGNPATLPGFDGEGGGTPNSVWGKPNSGASIWDDTFGGHGPTVRPATFTVPSLVGPGLGANLVQLGPNTLRF